MRRKFFGRTTWVLAVAAAAVLAGVSSASATKGDPEHKVTICHATASRKNPYVVITVDIASIVGGGHGRSGVNIGDIIPPFDIAGQSYPGHNWDAEHRAIFENDCNRDGTNPPPLDETTTTTFNS
jgi:hypothetical protein